jgi:hypothetical protein
MTTTSAPGEGATSLPSPSPTLQAEFQDVTLIPGRLPGDWSVIGLVTNESASSVGGVEVDISLYDAEDTLLAAQTVKPMLTILDPGAQSPFSARFPSAGAAARVEAEVIDYLPSSQPSIPIEVEQLDARVTSDGRTAVYGRALNSSQQTVEIVDLVLMASSSAGEPVALSEPAAGLSILDAGGSAPFVAVLGATDIADRLSSFSNARPVASRIEPSLSFSVPLRVEVDHQGSPLVIGAVLNDGDNWTSADIVVSLKNGDELVGLGEVKLPWPLAPGESQPFLVSDFPGLLQRMHDLGIEPTGLAATAEIDPAGSETSTSPPVSLQASVTAEEVLQGSLFLKGSLTNAGSEKVDRPCTLVVLRSTQGEVITAGFLVAGDELGAGETLPFTLTLPLPEGADLGMAEFDVRAGGFLPE